MLYERHTMDARPAINLARAHARRVLQEVKKCGDRGLLKTERVRASAKMASDRRERMNRAESSRDPERLSNRF